VSDRNTVELAACEWEGDGGTEQQQLQQQVSTHADFRIMPAAGGGGTNRSFAVAADVVARAARGHL